MAEIDKTGREHEPAGTGQEPGTDPAPREPVIAQRSSLPMRKASTMPDVSRFLTGAHSAGQSEVEPDAEAPAGSPHASRDGVGINGGAHSAPVDPATAALPVTEPDTRVSHSAPADPATAALPVAAPAAGDSRAASPGTDADSHSAPAGPATAALPVADSGAGTAAGHAAGAHVKDPETRVDPVRNGTGAEPASTTGSLSLRPSEEEVQRRARERDHAVRAKPVLARFLQVLIALFFPVIVLAGAVRAVTSSLFLWAEYHRPGFPSDSFGFSTEDRMTYGSYAVDYVLNLAPARYLGGLVDAQGRQLFLDSEVSHMQDVKSVLGASFVVAAIMLLASIAACIYLARRYKGGIRRALFSGAVLTIALIAALAATAVLAWELFFAQVHGLFFAEGTWTFREDDTLIRLFPEQFWTDAAATVGVLVLLATVLTLIAAWPTRARRARSRAAQIALQERHRAAGAPSL